MGLGRRTAAEHPDTIPLIDEHGDTLWVVDREWYYGLGDLATPE